MDAADPGPRPIPAPSMPLADYLAAIPEQMPVVSDEVTGLGDYRGLDDSDCRRDRWDRYDCEDMFPKQATLWVRWACMHGDEEGRSVACARLAGFIYRGIGGPRNPEFAKAMFAKQCKSAKSGEQECCIAASTVVFDDPELGLKYLGRVPAYREYDPSICGHIMREVDAGVRARTVVVEEVTGLDDVPVETECSLWIWSRGHGYCHARLDCAGKLVYGFVPARFTCDNDLVVSDRKYSADDGDPALTVDASSVVVADTELGRFGEFMLRGRLVTEPSPE